MTEINGYTRTCGLLGNPVEHTLSPLIQNTLAQVTGENLTYVPFHVSEGMLGDAVKGAFALNLLGLNVTVPYKSEVLPFLTETDPLAERIGAVNTLVRTEEGFRGYNTDMPGLYRAMCADGVHIEGEKVLILGAGGVARAVAMLLADKKAKEIILLNRSVERAQIVAGEVNSFAGARIAQAMPLSAYKELPGQERYLAVQATSVGMYPCTKDAVITEDAFYRKIHTGYDLIFNPECTKFMELVKAQGGRAFNGSKMLLYQGIIAYELWTGRSIDEALAQQVYNRMQAAGKRRTDTRLDGNKGVNKTGESEMYR